MIDRVASWCIQAIVIAMIVWSPWAFGSVHPPFELWVAYGIAGVLILVAVQAIFRGHMQWLPSASGVRVAACLYCLYLIAIFGTQQLPESVIATLSPNVPRLCTELNSVEREIVSGMEQPVGSSSRWSAGNRLSLNPGGSNEFSVRLLALTALFLAVGSLRNDRSVLLRVSIAGAVVGAGLAFYSLTYYFNSSTELMYGYFRFKAGGFGPFINRNHYPFFANLALGLTMGLLLDRFADKKRDWLSVLTQDVRAMWLIAAMVFIMTSIVVCVSRGGFVSMILALALCLCARLRPGHSAGTLIAALASVGGLVILLTWIGFDIFASRLSTITESDQMREDGRCMASQEIESSMKEYVLGSGTAVTSKAIDHPPATMPLSPEFASRISNCHWPFKFSPSND